MVCRPLLVFAWLFSLVALPASAQRFPRQQQDTTRADVYIYVTFENDRPVKEFYRVQVLSAGRMPLAEQLTNDRGQVEFRGIGVGSYQILVSGADVENAEINFTIGNHETTHTEYVRVKKKPDLAGAASSNEGSVSAAALNVPDKARKEFDKGVVALNKEDLAAARQHLSKAVEIYPQYSAAFLNLGVISIREKNKEEAEDFFEKAINADEHSASGYIYLSRVKMMDGKYPEADNLLQKAASIAPLDPDLLTTLAKVQFKEAKFADAVTTARKVHTVPHQQYAIAHLIAAQALMQEKLPEQAADEFRWYLKESPTGPNAESARAALQSIESRTR